MAQSENTKICRIKLWLYRILDWLCLIAPVLIYVCIALCDDGVVAAQKIAVVSSVMIAGILVLFNIIFQKRIRCSIWIILLGLFIAVKDYLLPLVIILAVVSIMDDFIFTPLIQHYKTALIANKEIDKRLGSESNAERKVKESDSTVS